VTLAAPSGEVRLELPLPGLFNVYNALAAAAAAFAVGIEGRAVATGLAQMRPVFGRGETLQVEGTELVILLMKNPAGANELLRTFAGAGRTDLWIALNDRMPDGRDISWIWDVDFEQAASAAGTVTCTGRRAAELALRLKYAGWEAVSVDESVESSLDHALAHARGRLVALPTYSAMLELRTLLTRRGLAAPYWA
jgi:UDP-N-acetylmuramyl tripeptide synthase